MVEGDEVGDLLIFLLDYVKQIVLMRITKIPYRIEETEESNLELYFSVDFEVLGQVIHHELIENGDSIRVSEENKEQYIE